MAYIQGIDRSQVTLLPPSLEEYVAPDSLVRVIDAFVDGLDIEDMGFARSRPADTGRPAYDPRALLKLYVYGYLNRTRSSRRLAAECTRNIEVMFLLGGLKPDFRTIADFRKDNCDAMRGVFAAFVRICAGIGLYPLRMAAVDGTKVRAQNARANAYNTECLQRKLANIEANIDTYLTKLDDEDACEDEEGQPDRDAILQVIAELRDRKETYEGYAEKIAATDATQVLTTDPEAHRMHTKDGFNCCYNIQAAVDCDTHMIAAFVNTSNPSDAGNIKGVGDELRRITGKESLEVVADKGYESARDILACLESGIIAHVALRYDSGERVFNLEYRPAELTAELLASTDPDCISTCLHSGTLPDCYVGKGVTIEVQSRDTLSCFTKEEDGTVCCPMGKTLSLKRIRRGRPSPEIYSSRDACRSCPNRCTDSAKAKEVAFGPDSDCVPIMMYGSPVHPPRQIPRGARISANNHNLDRKGHAELKVVVKIADDKDKLHVRMCTVEHPFGTVKWYDGAHYLLMRGRRKTTAEMSLSFLSYNIRRAMSLVGAQRLIAACG